MVNAPKMSPLQSRWRTPKRSVFHDPPVGDTSGASQSRAISAAAALQAAEMRWSIASAAAGVDKEAVALDAHEPTNWMRDQATSTSSPCGLSRPANRAIRTTSQERHSGLTAGRPIGVYHLSLRSNTPAHDIRRCAMSTSNASQSGQASNVNGVPPALKTSNGQRPRTRIHAHAL